MSKTVRSMFDSIAGRYDTLNHILSSGRDMSWRRRSVGLLPGLGVSMRVLDLCGGTGDFSLALRKSGFQGDCVLADFSRPMLGLSRKKSVLRAEPVLADALSPPFKEKTFDALLCAFGMRNLDNVEEGIHHAHGLLKTGGCFLTLEFFRPTTPFSRILYHILAPVLMPLVGKILGSRSSAYAYLADSVAGFCNVEEYRMKCQAAGFIEIQILSLDFGVAHAVLARKGI